MKIKIYKLVILFSLFLEYTTIQAQTLKVAILDFENTSGIPKYDGLGKAMSSMLISDIASNVSPRRLQLVERSQIQKILKEQNFQASSAVDKTSTVKAGKILGVKYLLLGDIYVLNDALIINARFVDAETGDIKFSKKQEGKLPAWLSLKTNIAKELATSISMPFTEPAIKDMETPIATITTFGNAISAKDTGNIQMAEKLAETLQEFSPEFKYVEDIKEDILKIKKQLEEQRKKIETLEKSGGLVINPKTYIEYYNNLLNPLINDSLAIYYVEYIIDYFPKDAYGNSDLYGYPLIWEPSKWNSYKNNKTKIINDLNRMLKHIKATKNKNIACKVYNQRIQNIRIFFGASTNKTDMLNDKDILILLNELDVLFASYLK